MTTPLELKNALRVALQDKLGVYRFAGGQTTPAIRIDDGSSPYSEEPTVTGLELVIVPSIEVSVRPMLSGYQDTHSTLISLKQWDIEQTTMELRTPLLEALSQFDSLKVDAMRRVIRSSKLDNIETLSVTLSESYWIEA